MGKLKWVTKSVSCSCQDPPEIHQKRQLSVSFPSAFRQLFMLPAFACPFRDMDIICIYIYIYTYRERERDIQIYTRFGAARGSRSPVVHVVGPKVTAIINNSYEYGKY